MFSLIRSSGIRKLPLFYSMRVLPAVAFSTASVLLSKSYPKLASLLHPKAQQMVLEHEVPISTICSWKCPNGEDHEWDMSIAKAIKAYTNNISHCICPFCNGSAVCTSNSLAFRDPDVADELVPSEPLLSQKLSYDSHKKVSWKCDRGEDHLHEQLVFRRTDVHAHCPFCMSSRVCKSNSLETRYPELGREFDEEQNAPLTADSILPTSTRCVWWKCSQGHQWKASVKNRVKGMGYCKVCGANHAVSLETVCPALSAFWDYDHNLDSSPRSATIGSQHYAHWICSRCQRGFRRRISDVFKQFVKNGSCCCFNCASDLP